jgi:hypothetical protein
LDRDLGPSYVQLGLSASTGRAEFEDATVWSAEGLPTTEERLQK